MGNVALYPYQEHAVERIVADKRLLVGYAMGTGKTAITLRACEEMMDVGDIADTVLVVVLASLKYQWQAEVGVWTDGSRAVVIDGSPAVRRKIQRSIDDDPPDYVVVNYEILSRDFEWFSARTWGAVVLDEAHAIKSFRAKRSKAVKALCAKTDVCIALTGTPISNGKPEEIYSIMQAVDPDILGRFDHFDRKYIVRNRQGWVERYRNLGDLNTRLSPRLISKRQSDPDVAPFLPSVVDAPPTVVAWDRAGAKAYNAIVDDLGSVLEEAREVLGDSWKFSLSAHYGETDALRYDPVEQEFQGMIMSRVQAMRMLCSHPEVLLESARKFASDETSDGSEFAAYLVASGVVGDGIRSPKMDAVASYVDDFLDVDGQNKVVVFSSFRGVLPILRDKYPDSSALYHGGMDARQKEDSRTRFQTDPGCRVLLSSDAGGFGVDLPKANLLVNYDLPWSSGAALQRNSRIIRASSAWPSVRVDRFLMEGSVEIRQWQALQVKGSVSDAVVAGTGSGLESLSVSNMRSLVLPVPYQGK